MKNVTHRFQTDTFEGEHGLPPFAGCETAPAAAAPPAEPAPPAAPAPAAPAGAEPAATPAGEPSTSELLSILDERLPAPPPPGPSELEIELGLAPAPQAPTSPPPQAAGLGPEAYPQAQPGVQQYQQPQDRATAEAEAIARMIDDRAREQAEAMISARLDPVLQQQAENQRRQEGEGLLEDYPELKEPGAGQNLLSSAQRWAGTIFSTNPAASQNPALIEAIAREPGFLELVHLAGRQLASARSETPVPGANGEVPIEQPGPASPGIPVSDQQNIVQGIVAAKKGGGLVGSAFAP